MSGFTGVQLANARIIYSVGRSLGASDRDIQIALITAMQESWLKNLNYGHSDSLGLFQQRPSMGWGSKEQVTDPVYAARAFFTGAGGNRGLLDLRGRNSMSMTRAAQAVQRSAFPDAYARHVPLVKAMWGKVAQGGSSGSVVETGSEGPQDVLDLLGEQQDAGPSPSAPAGLTIDTPVGLDTEDPVGMEVGRLGEVAPNPVTPMDPEKFAETFGAAPTGAVGDLKGWRGNVIQAAKRLLGKPYVWGGTSWNGVDCSGLVQLAFQQAGFDLPRVSYQQANYGKRVRVNALEPGDLVAWDNSSRNNGADHIAIYLGGGKIIEAPRTGLNVRIRTLDRDGEGAWGVKMPF